MKAPWKWSEDGLQLIDATGRTVLKIRPSDATQEEFDAICAAPELLAACKAALIKLKANPLDRISVAHNMVADAIAKAEGRS